MSRVKRSVQSRKYRKKILKLHAKGMRGRSKNCFSIAIQKVEKGLAYAYRDRKEKKRFFRGLWIVRINAGLRELGLKYSNFFHKLKFNNISINRKMLADMALHDKEAFNNFVLKVNNM